MARLDDGYQTLITFQAYPGVKFYEKTVTPPGVSGGGEVDTTTMLNQIWRTRNPKALKTLSNASATCAYDPAVYPIIVNNLINVNTLVFVTFPDTQVLTFWGWLDEFTPGEHVEGEQPTADITIIASNQNGSGVEVGPTLS